MSNTARRCDPRFPTAGVLLDNSALVRLWKCDALALLASTVNLYAAGQVYAEFRKQGPEERAALERLGMERLRVVPGERAWEHLARIRGGRHSTGDLGEDESLALALAHAERGQWLPFVTYDAPATRDSVREGVAAMDFLDTLAWLVGCGVLSREQADEIEQKARSRDGWRPPAGYLGSVEQERPARQQRFIARVARWKGR